VDELRYLPRWFRPRAERLTAALCELVIEAHGHEELLLRAASAAWGQALGAAIGLGPRAPLPLVAELCQAALRPEAERLDVVVERDGLRLPDGRHAPWFAVDGERVVALAREAPAARDAARVLGAARLLAHRGDLVGLALPPRPPGQGPRELVALALLADVVLERAPDAPTAALALGELDGLGLPLAVYDGVTSVLERWLHKGTPASWRAAPLLLLREQRLRLEADAGTHAPERLREHDLRFARDLLLTGREDDGPPPPRRPQRRVRRARGFVPPAGPARLSRNLELFAP
jgi:hypothetical protein